MIFESLASYQRWLLTLTPRELVMRLWNSETPEQAQPLLAAIEQRQALELSETISI